MQFLVFWSVPTPKQIPGAPLEAWARAGAWQPFSGWVNEWMGRRNPESLRPGLCGRTWGLAGESQFIHWFPCRLTISPKSTTVCLCLPQGTLWGWLWGEVKLFLQFIPSLFFSSSSLLRKDQLEAAARYVSDHEFPSSRRDVGTEEPVQYGVGTRGSMVVLSSRLGLIAVADHCILLPFSC